MQRNRAFFKRFLALSFEIVLSFLLLSNLSGDYINSIHSISEFFPKEYALYCEIGSIYLLQRLFFTLILGRSIGMFLYGIFTQTKGIINKRVHSLIRELISIVTLPLWPITKLPLIFNSPSIEERVAKAHIESKSSNFRAFVVTIFFMVICSAAYFLGPYLESTIENNFPKINQERVKLKADIDLSTVVMKTIKSNFYSLQLFSPIENDQYEYIGNFEHYIENNTKRVRPYLQVLNKNTNSSYKFKIKSYTNLRRILKDFKKEDSLFSRHFPQMTTLLATNKERFNKRIYDKEFLSSPIFTKEETNSIIKLFKKIYSIDKEHLIKNMIIKGPFKTRSLARFRKTLENLLELDFKYYNVQVLTIKETPFLFISNESNFTFFPLNTFNGKIFEFSFKKGEKGNAMKFFKRFFAESIWAMDYSSIAIFPLSPDQFNFATIMDFFLTTPKSKIDESNLISRISYHHSQILKRTINSDKKIKNILSEYTEKLAKLSEIKQLITKNDKYARLAADLIAMKVAYESGDSSYLNRRK